MYIVGPTQIKMSMFNRRLFSLTSHKQAQEFFAHVLVPNTQTCKELDAKNIGHTQLKTIIFDSYFSSLYFPFTRIRVILLISQSVP